MKVTHHYSYAHDGYGASHSYEVEDGRFCRYWKNDSFIQSKYSTISRSEFLAAREKISHVFPKFGESVYNNDLHCYDSVADLTEEEIECLLLVAAETRSWQEAIS